MSEATEKALAACVAAGITCTAEFVPFSKSRSAKPIKSPNDLSLNWKVTIEKGGATRIVVDYTEGIAHAPSYNRTRQGRATSEQFAAMKYETETGLVAARVGYFNTGKQKIPGPSVSDVMYSLLMDAEAIDHPSFEDWAQDFGYETDSRKAEKIYLACLDHGLKLRAMFGDTGLATLREAFQDY
jgi:hypothetical protein